MKHIGNMNQRHVSMFVYRNVLVCFAWQNDFKCYLFDIGVVFFFVFVPVEMFVTMMGFFILFMMLENWEQTRSKRGIKFYFETFICSWRLVFAIDIIFGSKSITKFHHNSYVFKLKSLKKIIFLQKKKSPKKIKKYFWILRDLKKNKFLTEKIEKNFLRKKALEKIKNIFLTKPLKKKIKKNI